MDESGGSGRPRPGTDEPTPADAQSTDARRTTPTRDAAKGDPSMGNDTDAPTTPTDEAPETADTGNSDRHDRVVEGVDSTHAGEAVSREEDEEGGLASDAGHRHGDARPDDGSGPTGPAPAPQSDDTSSGNRPEPPTADTHPDRTLAHSGAKPQPPQRPESPRGGLLMGRPFGVPVYVAPSWFLVAALITWVFGGQLDRVLPELGAARYLVALFFAVAFYASVLVHELAHTIAALRFKLPVRRIQLQFFGGVSEIEKEAETPGREFWLAFVGPLLSLVLAGIFYVAMQPVEPGTVPGVLLAGLMISNLIVAVFNLLPGLPLDGGRMLRAVVWKITGKPMSGTIAAAWVGRALAVSVLIGLPLLTQSGALGSTAEDSVGMDTVTDALLAAILAAIIWTGAGNSLRMARLREHLPELRARNLTRRAVPVETDTPLSEALRRANAAGARALVVVDSEGNPLSLVREAAIVGVPEHRRPWVAVSGLAQDLTDGMRVSAELAGEDLLDVLRATPATEYLVVEETGEIYGVLSAADVERAFVKAMARPN
ncbi:site-2 protease family protein [Streptomyces sp. NPDC005648]|uniref:site-2 protease family protein n=1 Tax=Streptomyces sp. NPDC005648 TaxID=3157044 RepID=UPI0033A414EC